MNAVKSFSVQAAVTRVGEPIPGSAYVRAYCSECSCAMRVSYHKLLTSPTQVCDHCQQSQQQRDGRSPADPRRAAADVHAEMGMLANVLCQRMRSGLV